MEPNPEARPSSVEQVPLAAPLSTPPLIIPPTLDATTPPPLNREPNASAGATRSILFLLSLCLGLFLADAAFSLLDQSLVIGLHSHLFTPIRGIVALFAMITAVLVYVLMGLTPIIPKRLFLPITLFNPIAELLVIPLLIYFYGQLEQLVWVTSLCQLVFALIMLYLVQGGMKFRWPLVTETRLLRL